MDRLERFRREGGYFPRSTVLLHTMLYGDGRSVLTWPACRMPVMAALLARPAAYHIAQHAPCEAASANRSGDGQCGALGECRQTDMMGLPWIVSNDNATLCVT